MRLVGVGIAFALLASASVALADEKAECIEAHADVQKLRRAGHFQEARARLASCLRDSCPAPVRVDCAAYTEAIEAAQPSVVFDVRDEENRPTVDAALELDGKPVSEQVGTVALRVDAGEHVATLVRPGGARKSIRFLAREGQGIQTVVVTFATTTPATQTSEPKDGRKRTIPTLAWGLFGVGAAGLVTSGIVGTLAMSSWSTLQDGCGKTQACTPSDVKSLDRQNTVADVALGIGIVSAAVGLAVVLFHGD